MRKLQLLTIIVSLIALFSCSKADNTMQKYAGPKKISRYQWIKADTLTGEFSQIIYDTDTMGRVILWDNASDTYNNANFFITMRPQGFINYSVGSGGEGIGWYADTKEGKSLTFFSEPNPGHVNYCIYTLNKKMNGKIILEAVFGSGKNLFKEIIELTPISED